MEFLAYLNRRLLSSVASFRNISAPEQWYTRNHTTVNTINYTIIYLSVSFGVNVISMQLLLVIDLELNFWNHSFNYQHITVLSLDLKRQGKCQIFHLRFGKTKLLTYNQTIKAPIYVPSVTFESHVQIILRSIILPIIRELMIVTLWFFVICTLYESCMNSLQSSTPRFSTWFINFLLSAFFDK